MRKNENNQQTESHMIPTCDFKALIENATILKWPSETAIISLNTIFHS
jgi:hypothetical protein